MGQYNKIKGDNPFLRTIGKVIPTALIPAKEI